MVRGHPINIASTREGGYRRKKDHLLCHKALLVTCGMWLETSVYNGLEMCFGKEAEVGNFVALLSNLFTGLGTQLCEISTPDMGIKEVLN